MQHRTFDQIDPLPTLGRKVQPELEDAKPTPEEQFEQGDYSELARRTIAGDESRVNWRDDYK